MKRLNNSHYVGKTRVVDKNGQVITADVVQKDVPRNYWKVSIENLIRNLGNMTPKAMRVVDYVLNHTNFKNNSCIGTNKTISKGCKTVGYTKVATTLSFLANHHVITRKPGVIMWNPEIINHKKQYQVPDLIIRYRVIDHKYKRVSSKADRKRTAKARKARAKARKTRDKKEIKRGWSFNSKRAKRLHIDYQTRINFGKNKKPVKN